MEFISLLQEADGAAIELEKRKAALEGAKLALENAKDALEAAKAQFEQTLARSDEFGVPKAKMKKLIEERTSALMASGIGLGAGVSVSGAPTEKVKTPKRPVAKKSKVLEDAEDLAAETLAFDQEDDGEEIALHA